MYSALTVTVCLVAAQPTSRAWLRSNSGLCLSWPSLALTMHVGYAEPVRAAVPGLRPRNSGTFGSSLTASHVQPMACTLDSYNRPPFAGESTCNASRASTNASQPSEMRHGCTLSWSDIALVAGPDSLNNFGCGQRAWSLQQQHGSTISSGLHGSCRSSRGTTRPSATLDACPCLQVSRFRAASLSARKCCLFAHRSLACLPVSRCCLHCLMHLRPG